MKKIYIAIVLGACLGDSLYAAEERSEDGTRELQSLLSRARRGAGSRECPVLQEVFFNPPGAEGLSAEDRDKKRFEAIEFLLSHGADPNPSWGPSGTLLHLATHDGLRSLMELLFRHRANVDATNNGGATPLHGAAARGEAELVALLLENNASPHARNEFGRTPWHLAKSKAIRDLLEEHGAVSDLQQYPKSQKSGPMAAAAEIPAELDDEAAIVIAAKKGRVDYIELMLRNCVDNGRTLKGLEAGLQDFVEGVTAGDRCDLVELFLKSGLCPCRPLFPFAKSDEMRDLLMRHGGPNI